MKISKENWVKGEPKEIGFYLIKILDKNSKITFLDEDNKIAITCCERSGDYHGDGSYNDYPFEIIASDEIFKRGELGIIEYVELELDGV
jgi:hypothetical protein